MNEDLEPEATPGELRGGYIPGDLPEADQVEAERLLYEHLTGPTRPAPPGPR